MADYKDIPNDVPGWAVATAVNSAIAHVIELSEAIQESRLTDAQIIAEGIEVDLNRWLGEAGQDTFSL
jgi:hypothetical protein